MDWPSESPDLNITENLWNDLKKSVHAQKPSNLTELEMFCKEEWSKIPPSRIQTFVKGYRSRLEAVIFSKRILVEYKGINIEVIVQLGCPDLCICLFFYCIIRLLPLMIIGIFSVCRIFIYLSCSVFLFVKQQHYPKHIL